MILYLAMTAFSEGKESVARVLVEEDFHFVRLGLDAFGVGKNNRL
jgi:hypothetical protein